MTTEFSADSRVLVIDDVVATRAIIRDMLQEIGFVHIEEAGSADEGLNQINECIPSVIICDFMLGGVSGLELRNLLREDREKRDIPFILMSSRSDLPSVNFSVGINTHFIFKPVGMDVLKQKLREVLVHSEYEFGEVESPSPKPVRNLV